MTVALAADLVDDPMFTTLARLAECLCKELAAANGPKLCFCGLWVGTDTPPLGVSDCVDGDCGVAWVRLVTAYPSSVFPQQDDGTRSRCAIPLAYEVEIGVARCAPRPVGREVIPSAEALFEAQRLYMSDMRAASRALMCCLPKAVKMAGEPEVLVSLGVWRPLENLAGKSGGAWQGWFGRS